MKIIIKIAISMLTLLVIISLVVGCKDTDTTSTPAQIKKITLDDGPTVLDMSSDLPSRFERLDAASEGFSNKDMGLGPEFTEVELFFSEEPYQMVFAYFCIIESQVERASSDAILRDDEQIKSMVLENLRAGAAEEGVMLTNATVEVSHPIIGDLAVFGTGIMDAYGVSVGYDVLFFKINKVYVFVISLYFSSENVSLVPLAEGMEQRIEVFSQ